MIVRYTLHKNSCIYRARHIHFVRDITTLRQIVYFLQHKISKFMEAGKSTSLITHQVGL